MSEQAPDASRHREPIHLTPRGKLVARGGLALAALASAGAIYANYQYQHPEIVCKDTTKVSLQPTQGEDSVVSAMVARNPKLHDRDLYQLREVVEDANPALKDPAHMPQVGETLAVPTNCNTHTDLF